MRAITIATVVALAPLTALADEAKDPHFEKASELKAKGDIAGACAEFKAALDANPNATGLLLNFAQCNVELGRFHTAIAYFTKLKQIATELGLAEYTRTADDQLAKLKDKPGQLALTFEEPPDATTKVTADDEVYDVMKETTIEVNPGQVHLVVSHPGRVSSEETISVAGGTKAKGILVHRLAVPKTVNNTWRNIGIVITGLGVGGVATGGIVGLVAKGNYNAQFKMDAAGPGDYCKNVTINGQAAVACGIHSRENTDAARRLGDVGTGLMIAGGIVAVGGATLWLVVGSREKKEKLAIVPVLAPDQAGVLAVGRF